MLCAQRRGDAVPKLFRDLAKGKNMEETKALFASFKLALNLTWAFTGLPQSIPACLGLVGELRELGINGTSQVDRSVGHLWAWFIPADSRDSGIDISS